MTSQYEHALQGPAPGLCWVVKKKPGLKHTEPEANLWKDITKLLSYKEAITDYETKVYIFMLVVLDSFFNFIIGCNSLLISDKYSFIPNFVFMILILLTNRISFRPPKPSPG